MGPAANFVGPVSKVLARLHRWYATAWLLARVPLAELDETSVGRLRYALMMSSRTRAEQTRRVFDRMLLGNQDTTPELRIELAAMATSINAPLIANSLLNDAARTATGSHTAEAANRLLSVNTGIADGSLQKGLGSTVDALALPSVELLTLVPVSGRYLELWHLWLQQVGQHVGQSVVAMAMDDAAWAALSAEPNVYAIDVRTFFSWDERGRLHPHTRGVLWYLRVLLLREFVQRRYEVLVLDLDAMPVGNLLPMLESLPAADVVAQRDHSIPVDVDRQLGFVLCCGFMVWRPTPASLALLDRFVGETSIERDDQLALNHLIAGDGIHSTSEDARAMQFQSCSVRFVCPDASLVSRSLHSGSLVRHFQQTGKSVAEIRAALNL